MNLISCEACGVVLDADNLEFPEDIEDENGSIDINKAIWNGWDYIPTTPCPVCKEQIPEPNK